MYSRSVWTALEGQGKHYLLALIVNTDKKHIESISAVRLIFRAAERSLAVLCCLGSSSGCNQNYNGGVFHLILSDSQSRMQKERTGLTHKN